MSEKGGKCSLRAAIHGDDHVHEIGDAVRVQNPWSGAGNKRAIFLKHGKPDLMTCKADVGYGSAPYWGRSPSGSTKRLCTHTPKK